MIDRNFKNLYEKIKENFNENDLQEIENAFNFAKKAHEGKRRLTHEDYIMHPLNVALILSDLNVDKTTLIGALLHETINNGTATYEELKENFNEEIADIVKTISTINKLQTVCITCVPFGL